MSASPNLADPFDDSVDHTTPFLSQEQSHPIHEQPSVVNPPGSSTLQSLDGPPLYQHPHFSSEEKNNAIPMLIQQPSVPAAAGFTIMAPAHTISVATETEWYETLRELQANLADLRITRSHISRFAVLARAAPQCLRPRRSRGIDENAREVHVLEELVLAGMRRLSRINPDPLVQAEWDSRAEEFSRTLRSAGGDPEAGEGSIALSGAEGAANGDLEGARAGRFSRHAARLVAKADKDTALVGLSKGIGILLITPVALAAAAAFGAGAMLYGSGRVIVGLGHLMTFGRLR